PPPGAPPPPPGTQPYATGPYQPAYPAYQPPPTNGMAIAALISGILWFFWIGSIVALVMGYVAKQQIDASNGTQAGRGLAIAGIVLGWVGIASLALVVLGAVSS
ncbi:MAG: DUF4190 domain-containing protein, partial [Actinomycetota bacterium]